MGHVEYRRVLPNLTSSSWATRGPCTVIRSRPPFAALAYRRAFLKHLNQFGERTQAEAERFIKLNGMAPASAESYAFDTWLHFLIMQDVQDFPNNDGERCPFRKPRDFARSRTTPAVVLR